MAQTTLNPIVLSILLINTPLLSQAHGTEQSVGLETVSVVGKSRPRATSGLLHTSTASDKIISGDTLRQKAVNLGDALDGVPGIHASQYGGGASAPVIRGQTGRRIKVLNHHGETGDMADFSPDHAIMVDTALSQQVEILRGPVTLLYSSGNVAGLVDVADGKIPEKMPENGVSGELGLRLSSGNLEKLTSGGINLRAEWKQPFPGFEALRVYLNRNDYRHDEKAGDAVENFFNNQTQNARIELRHQPIGRLKGSWGVQYLQQKSSALSATSEAVKQPMLLDNKVQHYSFFGVEQANWDNFTLEGGVRVEKQKASIRYDKALIDRENYYNHPLPDLGAHRQTARSFALSGNWYFTPQHKLSLTASHQERLPSTQELYAHGKHVATNTFEVGNKHLNKERSNNIELALGYEGDRWQYNLALYRNRFGNYIYAQTLNDGRGPKSIEDDSEMKLVRYNQSGADFYGAEGEIYFKPTPRYRIGVSGDYVRGRLKNLPSLPGREDAYGNRPFIAQDDQNAPRVPAARLGVHLKASLTDRIDANLDYYRVFAQNKLARYETRTPGHHMLNLGANYRRNTRYGEWNWYVKADNLLNQSVYAHSSFLSDTPQMGRSFTGGVNVKF